MRSVCTSVLLSVRTVFSAFPARAEFAPITCGLDGTGTVVFDPVTNIDHYVWSGEIDRCTVPVAGVFTGQGYVATVGGHGTGTLSIVWEDGQHSQVEFVVTGIPEFLAMTGKVTAGRYDGRPITMEMRCKLHNTDECFQFGTSTWDFLGTITFL